MKIVLVESYQQKLSIFYAQYTFPISSLVLDTLRQSESYTLYSEQHDRHIKIVTLRINFLCFLSSYVEMKVMKNDTVQCL
jgi:hypothetical protein